MLFACIALFVAVYASQVARKTRKALQDHLSSHPEK